MLSKVLNFPFPKVLPWQFEAIVTALTSDESKPTCRVFTTRTGKCPGQAIFHKYFYRLLDSNDLHPAVKAKLVEAEQGIFIREVSDCTISANVVANVVLRCWMVATGHPIRMRRTRRRQTGLWVTPYGAVSPTDTTMMKSGRRWRQLLSS